MSGILVEACNILTSTFMDLRITPVYITYLFSFLSHFYHVYKADLVLCISYEFVDKTIKVQCILTRFETEER